MVKNKYNFWVVLSTLELIFKYFDCTSKNICKAPKAQEIVPFFGLPKTTSVRCDCRFIQFLGTRGIVPMK